ncbi:MAG: SDR family oxidoreductase, partial [Candidatus Omnitrophica bacterium]|nr:SDR family oxidoreductase [Candidatus Omnitrophota bacterium]
MRLPRSVNPSSRRAPPTARAQRSGAGKNLFSLEGQVALVTGALGQLGRQLVRVLGEAGAHVIVADLDEGRCQQLCRQLREEHLNASWAAFDVTDPEAVRAAFQRFRQAYGGCDVLVNNAGIAVFTPFEERAFEEFMKVLRVNVGGMFLCTQAAVPLMKDRPSGGRIVNIGSMYGVVSGDPRIYTDTARNTSEVYAASKAAVIQLTRYWAIHLARYRIRVNALSPGGIENQQGSDFVKQYSFRTPLGRMGQVTELSGALLFLASEASSYVT